MKWEDVKNSEGFKNISFMGIANIGGTAISGLFWLYLGNLMGEENYGEIAFLLSIGGITMSIVIWGSEKALMVYTAKGLNIQPPIYIISIITTGIGTIILFVIFNNIGLSFYVLGGVIAQLAVAELLGRKQFKQYSKFFMLQKILFVTVALGLYFVLGPIGILLGFGFSCLIYAQRIYKTIKETEIDFGLIKKKSEFIINNYIVDLSGQVGNQIDRLLIGPIFGFALLGNYFLAIQILNVLVILPEVVAQYTIPHDASGNSTKKIKILTVGTAIGLAIIVIFTAPILLPTLFPEYEEAVLLVPIIAVAIIPITISYQYISKFLGSEKTRIVLISYFIEIIILIPGIIILGEMMGIIGLGIIFVFATIAKAIFLAIMDNFLKYQNISKND